MTFSPDDYDTFGLELVPIEGEEPTNPLDGYTAEQQAAAAKLYSVVEKPVIANDVVAEAESAVVEVSPESGSETIIMSKEEAYGLRSIAQEQENIFMGEVKASLMNGNVEAAQAAFTKAVEARIQQAELSIVALKADFEGGNFQNRGSSEDPNVRSIYEYQVGGEEKLIDGHNQRLEFIKNNPRRAFASEGLDKFEGNGDTAYEIRQLIKTAESYQAEEAKGSTFASYNGELIGMINSSLEDPNMSQDLKSAIKEASRKITKLPSDLKQKVGNLA